jgi:hypothetical protein
MDHLYKPKDAVHDVVMSADNHEMECHYQGHSFYDKAKAICLALHLTFIKYCPTRSRATNSSLRRSIWIFFDFIEAYNARNPAQLWILKITDLSAEVYKQFENHLLKSDESLALAARLKTALKNASSMTDAIPDLLLPFAKRASTQARLPFSDETENSLANAFTSSIDRLYEILEFRKLVSQATPYTFTEIISKVTYSKETIFQWLQHRFDSGFELNWSALHAKLKLSSNPELREIASLPNWRGVIYSAYKNRSEEFQFENPENPFQFRKILNFNPDPARVIRTFIENGYPFEVELDEIIEKYSAIKVNAFEKCSDVIQLIMHRWSKPVTPPGFSNPIKWDDLLNLYYPSMQDMSCIVQFIMLQTNWNKEAVLALDPNNFEHALTGAMNEKHVMIQTEKNRSQGIAKPYYAPKEIIAASTTTDMYSARNLILLAIKLSEPLAKYEFDYVRHGMTSADYNTTFLCLRFFADWTKKGGRHTSASNEKAFQQGIKQFLKEFPIFDEDGERLMSGIDLTWRLRPTWVKRRKQISDSSSSHGMLAMLLGHASTVTTDVHYDNSPPAQQERYDRLESELEAVLRLMRSGKFEGMLGTPPKEAAIQLPLKIFHIPGMERPLWGCANQRKPTWIGAARNVPLGQRCYVVSKCMFCSQCIIFEDSLPYLIERRIHVVEIIDDQPKSASEYSNDWEVELIKIDSILENWEDEQAVREASRYQRRNTPLLPRDMNFLQVILEEEDRQNEK